MQSLQNSLLIFLRNYQEGSKFKWKRPRIATTILKKDKENAYYYFKNLYKVVEIKTARR